MSKPLLWSPSPELYDLADSFSKIYKQVDDGKVMSSDGNRFIIKMSGVLYEKLRVVSTFVRVNNKTGIIEFSRRALLSDDRVNENYVFYLVLWCACKYDMRESAKRSAEDFLFSKGFKGSSDSIIDKLVNDYYKTTGRSADDVTSGLTAQLEISGNDFGFAERVEETMKQFR